MSINILKNILLYSSHFSCIRRDLYITQIKGMEEDRISEFRGVKLNIELKTRDWVG